MSPSSLASGVAFTRAQTPDDGRGMPPTWVSAASPGTTAGVRAFPSALVDLGAPSDQRPPVPICGVVPQM